VDEFNGIDDIEKGIIRGVGNPAKRFEEDALRMMRALRFSAQLGFEIEEQTYTDLCANADLIKNISIERIRDEFTKLITSSHCERLDLLINSGMEKHFLPELTHIIEESNTERLYASLNNLPQNPVYRLAFLFKDASEKTVSKILKRLRYDNKTAAKTAEIVKYLNFEATDEYSCGKLLSLTDYSKEIFTIQTEICQYYEKSSYNIEIAQKICDNIIGNCHRISQLAINGADLQAIGLHGKDIGTALSAALDYVLRHPDRNTKTYILTYLKEMTENEK
jgi:tRNA nucleotidyltransferase (CCA-adding enzyme)